MERWRGRVAVVTGASSGIGAAIAYQLQDAGLTVVALARRAEKISSAVEEARKKAEERNRTPIGKAPSPGKLHSVKCDVSKEEDILEAFTWIKNNVGGVDILVNNAGIGNYKGLIESPTEIWRQLLDTNVLGLSICTREAIKLMRENGVDDGHVVHISSVAGHGTPAEGKYAMYSATKNAVRVLTEGLRKELVAAKSRIRVTEVSPGLVKTDIFYKVDGLPVEDYLKMPMLMSEDVADAVLYAVSVPSHVQVHEIMVKPIGEEF